MPTFRVTDHQNGVTLDLTGDSPPTEAELVEIFDNYKAPAPVSETGPTRQAAGRFASGLSSMVAGIPESAARIKVKGADILESVGLPRLGGSIFNPFLTSFDTPRTPQETLEYKVGQGIRDVAGSIFPVDENRPKSFLADTLPQGAGSMVGAIAGGVAGKALKIPAWLSVAATGAGAGGAEGAREAESMGGDSSQTWTSLLVNAGAGLTEAVPIAGWLNRVNRASGGAAIRAIKEGSEEALQEIFQQAVGNINASKIAGFDPNRPWYSGTGEGGAAGLTLGTLGSLLFNRRGPKTPPAKRSEEDLTKPLPPAPIIGRPGENMADVAEANDLTNIIMGARKARQQPEPPESAPAAPVQPPPSPAPPASPAAAPPQAPAPVERGPTMGFARAVVGMDPQEFRNANPSGFNDINIPLGQTVTEPELAELIQLRDRANARLADAMAAFSKEKSEANQKALAGVMYMPQFYNGAIAEAQKRFPQKPKEPGAVQNAKPILPASGNVPAQAAVVPLEPGNIPPVVVEPSVPKAPVALPVKKTVIISTGKPKGAQAEVEYDVVEAQTLKPMVVTAVGEAQTRQRAGNVASMEQIANIASNTDPNLLLESPTAITGAPVIDDVVLAGNGRTSGIIAGYDGFTPSIQQYRAAVVEAAKRLGLGDVTGIAQPVLVRRVKRYVSGDRRAFVVESNPKYGALKETVAEAALSDAEALGDVSTLDFNNSGQLTAGSLQLVAKRLEAAQRGLVRTTAGDFDANEANRRVQLATLAMLAKENNIEVANFIGLLESDDGRRVMGEISKAAPRLVKLDADLKIGGRILQAMRELQSGIVAVRDGAYNSLPEWYAERRSELLKTELSPAAEALLQFMVEGQKKPTILREFLNNYLTKAEYEQNQRNEAKQTDDIFGEQRAPVTAESIVNTLLKPGETGRPVSPPSGAGNPPEVRPEVKYQAAWKKWQDTVEAAQTEAELDAALKGAGEDPERSTETYSDIQQRVVEKKRVMKDRADEIAEAKRRDAIKKLPLEQQVKDLEAQLNRIRAGYNQRFDLSGEVDRAMAEDERAKEIQSQLENLRLAMPGKPEVAFPPYPKRKEGASMTDAIKGFANAVRSWEKRVEEWLKTKPENKAIVWKSSNIVYALTKNINAQDAKTPKPWRVTRYVESKDGTALMPSGHEEYLTRESAMRQDANSQNVVMLDKLPMRVMDEQEIQGYKLMKDIPDKSKLVWYSLGIDKTVSGLQMKLRGTTYLQNFVRDSKTKAGNVAFVEPVKPEDQKYLGLSAPSKEVSINEEEGKKEGLQVEPKFKEGDRVMVGTYPMNREGVIAANGPFKDGRFSYFVKTNLGEVLYQEEDIQPIAEVEKKVEPKVEAETPASFAVGARVFLLAPAGSEKKFINGSKQDGGDLLGDIPMPWTILKETTDPKFPDERVFDIQNNKTKEIQRGIGINQLQQAKSDARKETTLEEYHEELISLAPNEREAVKVKAAIRLGSYNTKAKAKEAIKRAKAKLKGDEPAANLGAGLPEGQGWDEAGVRGAVADENTAGFTVKIINRDEAVSIAGINEAAGYGGFFFNGQVYLIADNIARGNVEGARRLLREEVGHGLLRTPEGLKLLTEVLAQGKLNLTKAEKSALLAKGYREHQLLDEFIAQSARENRSWWQKVVDTVRAYLSKAGLNLTNAETARLLLARIRKARGSNEAVQSGAPAPGLSDLSPEELNRINRELNKLLETTNLTPQQQRRRMELERKLGQQDLFGEGAREQAEAELEKKRQRAEIERRQGQRLVAGQIEDQGGLFAPKEAVRQDDMFAAPSPKTEAPPATAPRRQPATDLFGDLAPGVAEGQGELAGMETPEATEEARRKFRKAQVLGLKLGDEYEVQAMGPIIENVRANVFDSRPDVTPERTEQALNLARLLADDRTKSIGSRELFEQLGGEGDAALQILSNELMDYATKMTIDGDQTLSRFLIENWGKLSKFLDGDGLSEGGRVLRAVQESKTYRIYKMLAAQIAEARASARAAIKVDESLWDKLVNGLRSIQIDRQTLEPTLLALPVGNGETLGGLLQPVMDQAASPDGAEGRFQAELGLELEEINRRVEQQAKALANKYELTVFPGKGKPNIVIQTIRDFLAQKPATENRPAADVPVSAALTVKDLADALVAIPATPESEKITRETADRLAYDVYEKRERNWQEARLKAQKKVSERGSIWSLVEEIRQSPFLAQKSKVWRLTTAENWFMRNGLSRDQAQAAAKSFNAAFEKKMLEASEEFAKKILKGKTDPRNIEDIVKGIRSGLLDPNATWSDFIANRDGWKAVSEENFRKLAELEMKLADPELSPQERAEAEELMMSIMRNVGPKVTKGMYWRRISEGFVASLLSGIRTMTIQASPVIDIARNFAIASLNDPKNAINFAKVIHESARNVFLPEMKFAWKKDAYGYHLEELDREHKELKRWWEQLQEEYKTAKNPAAKASVRLRQLYAMQQYVSRTLSTIDQSMMATGREIKLAYYASSALKESGISTSQISQLVDAISLARKQEYDSAIADGLDENTAKVRANARIDRVVWEFVNNMTGSESLANQVLKSSENDVYSVVGRKAAGVKEEDEGFLSTPMNKFMTSMSKLRGEGGPTAILAVALAGFVNVPFRTARYFSSFHPYGLLRYGLYRYRTNKGLENWWKQTYGTELQAKQRLREAIAGTIVTLLASAWASGATTADDDAEDKEFGFYITGAGPSRKELRDAWLKAGWRPYSMIFVINGVKVKIPITRIGEALMFPMMLPASIDDAAWKKKERKASGRPDAPAWNTLLGSIVGTHMYMSGQKGMMQGVVQLAQAAQGGQGVVKSSAKILGGTLSASAMPFKQLINSVSEMLVGPLDQSSASALVASQFPIVGMPWQKKAINRFGDEVGDRSWFGVLERTGIPVAFRLPNTSQNRAMYPVLADKGASPPQLRRSILEERFGELTNNQFEDYATKSGAMLKQSVSSNLSAIKRMTPEEAKEFLEKAAGKADKTAAAALGLVVVKKPAKTEASSEDSSPSAVAAVAVRPSQSGSAFRSRFGRSRSGLGRLASFRTPRLRRGRIRASRRSAFRRVRSGGRIRRTMRA